MSVYLGIDPGKSGGLAIVENKLVIDCTPMPSSELDLWNLVNSYDITDCACIEKVHAYPGQGVTSMFTFGQNYGSVRMAVIAADIPLREVTPRGWQKALGIPVKKKEESKPQFKERLRQHCQRLFPRSKNSSNLWHKPLGVQRSVCDAILIAEYLRREENGN